MVVAAGWPARLPRALSDAQGEGNAWSGARMRGRKAARPQAPQQPRLADAGNRRASPALPLPPHSAERRGGYPKEGGARPKREDVVAIEGCRGSEFDAVGTCEKPVAARLTHNCVLFDGAPLTYTHTHKTLTHY